MLVPAGWCVGAWALGGPVLASEVTPSWVLSVALSCRTGPALAGAYFVSGMRWNIMFDCMHPPLGGGRLAVMDQPCTLGCVTLYSLLGGPPSKTTAERAQQDPLTAC